MSRLAETLSDAVAFGRRALLRRSVWGGAAVTAGALGSALPAFSTEAPRVLFDPNGEGFRRVVTGNTAAGKSYVMKDERIKYGEIWRSVEGEPLGAGGPSDPNKVWPPDRDLTPGQKVETRWFYTAIQPTKAPFDRANLPGMHRTSALSYVMVTSGEVMVVLDEGEVTITAGDLLVMRNATHAWHNATSSPTGLLISMRMV